MLSILFIRSRFKGSASVDSHQLLMIFSQLNTFWAVSFWIFFGNNIMKDLLPSIFMSIWTPIHLRRTPSESAAFNSESTDLVWSLKCPVKRCEKHLTTDFVLSEQNLTQSWAWIISNNSNLNWRVVRMSYCWASTFKNQESVFYPRKKPYQSLIRQVS